MTGFEPAHAGSGDRCPSSWATPLFNLVRKGGLEPPVAEAMRFSSARVIQLHHFRTNKPGGSRTHGLLVKSQLLSPLSYGPAITDDEGETRTLKGDAHGLLRPARLPVAPLRRQSDPGRIRTSDLRLRRAALSFH